MVSVETLIEQLRVESICLKATISGVMSSIAKIKKPTAEQILELMEQSAPLASGVYKMAIYIGLVRTILGDKFTASQKDVIADTEFATAKAMLVMEGVKMVCERFGVS